MHRSFAVAMFAGDLIGPMIAFGLEATRLNDRVPGARSTRARWKRPLERHDASGVLIVYARRTAGVGVSDGFVLALPLVVLAVTLARAVARPPYVSEAAAACPGGRCCS